MNTSGCYGHPSEMLGYEYAQNVKICLFRIRIYRDRGLTKICKTVRVSPELVVCLGMAI